MGKPELGSMAALFEGVSHWTISRLFHSLLEAHHAHTSVFAFSKVDAGSPAVMGVPEASYWRTAEV